jgi:hypothetical protein
VRQSHQITVGAWRIDDKEIEAPLHRAHGVHELLKFRGFVIGDLHGFAELDAAIHGDLEIEAGVARRLLM